MGHVRATIRISNSVEGAQRALDEVCLVDSGASFLCIPQRVAVQRGLKEQQKREVTLAGGSVSLLPYVGPIKVEFENRILLEDMDFVIHPKLFQLSVNPASPNIASGLAK